MSKSNNDSSTSTIRASVPVAIYTRVSTDGQVGHRFDSCEHQANVCREFIVKNQHVGWFEAGHFSDEAYSGATLERPGIRQLMQRIAFGQVKIVLVYKLERIARSVSEWSRLQEFLREHGCQLLSPTEDHSDTTASGRLKSNMMMSFAEYERLNVMEKIRSKMRAQAQRGMWGGGFIPFGYTYDHERQQLQPSSAEAPTVQRIFQRAAELQPLASIAKELNEEGLRTGIRWMRNSEHRRRAVGQKLFRPDLMAKMIQNPLYRGMVRFEGKEFKGQHEALVSAQIWEQANAAMAEAKRNRQPRLRKQDKYANMLKGLGCCAASGSLLFSGASGKPGPGNVVYRYYTCSQRRGTTHNCLLGSISAQPLEAVVVGFLTRMATDAGTLELLCDSSPSLQVTHHRIKAGLENANDAVTRVEKRIGNCLDVIADNGAVVIIPELIQRATALAEEKQRAIVQRVRFQQKLYALEACAVDRERVRHAAERLGRVLPGLEPTKQTELVRGLIARVTIDAGKDQPSREQKGRIIRVGLHLRIDRLITAMERDVVPDERCQPTTSDGRCVELELRALFGSRRRVEILTPFPVIIGDDPQPVPSYNRVAHPIHRATKWQAQIGRASVRSIASMEKVSPSLVSLHLKLLRLAPEIQIFVRELTAARAVRHFSLRRLAALSELESEQQLAKFSALRVEFLGNCVIPGLGAN